MCKQYWENVLLAIDHGRSPRYTSVGILLTDVSRPGINILDVA